MPDATERMTLDEYKRMRDGKLPPMRVEPGAQTKEDRRRESALQRDCENELNRRGIYHFHISYRGREKKGHPDLTFSIKGQAYAVELKSGRHQPTDEQRAALLMMGNEANGAIARVIRDFDSFVRLCDGDLGAGEAINE